jgi:hypothetical protein
MTEISSTDMFCHFNIIGFKNSICGTSPNDLIDGRIDHCILKLFQ